jgi:hypothetical protein
MKGCRVVLFEPANTSCPLDPALSDMTHAPFLPRKAPKTGVGSLMGGREQEVDWIGGGTVIHSANTDLVEESVKVGMLCQPTACGAEQQRVHLLVLGVDGFKPALRRRRAPGLPPILYPRKQSPCGLCQKAFTTKCSRPLEEGRGTNAGCVAVVRPVVEQEGLTSWIFGPSFRA